MRISIIPHMSRLIGHLIQRAVGRGWSASLYAMFLRLAGVQRRMSASGALQVDYT
jgi:hypothetical protein